ncbi:hypothetical protein [Poseidonibacter sp.]|uniref:hypothetical protein n=1 Tax=Poseidonibacter sp. TaxID=2321188 RepID=UPI00359E9750
MIFNDLELETKKELHKELTTYANSIGGINYFLSMLEEIRKEKPNCLLNKTATFPYSQGKISWNKSIYKDTLTLLFSAMRKEEKDGDMLSGISTNDYRNTMNMMKTLKPVGLTIRPKNSEDGEGFSFSILDASQSKKTKVSLIFKIIFFYNVDFAKNVLTYENTQG